MKIKNKIQSKICDLEVVIEDLDQELKTLINDPLCRNYPKIGHLCDSINIIMNEIGTLKELY